MTVQLITRAQWGARPPLRALTQVPWSDRVGVAAHYTFGDKADSPLDLQRYAQDTLGYADGHYNLLVDWLGNAYEGRGWTVSAAHSEGENVEWIGICFIGKDADVTPEAEATITALVAGADVLAGRKLALAGHQELPGANTSCPGSRLMALVNRLRTGGDDMLEGEQAQALDNANKAMWFGGTAMGEPVADEDRVSSPDAYGNSVVDQLSELRAGMRAVLARPSAPGSGMTAEEVRAIVRDELDSTRLTAVEIGS